VVSDLIPVLWLCGPPGIGKSTVGWEIFTQITQAGIEAGSVDIDQLGMCYPEPASDPGRHRIKARNLGAVVANYRAAGARCVIVSGVVDPGRGVHADLISRAAVTVCRLRADRDELRQRFLGRGEQAGLLDDVLSQADAMDASDVADVCVDTSGLAPAEAARLVRERIAGWPVLTGPGRPYQAGQYDSPATAADGQVLVLCGATGVGKSTAGFEVYRRTLRAGFAAAYIDLDQIGFCHPVPAGNDGGHQVKARNLAAMWHTYRAAGAQCLIAVGPVESEAAAKAYADALPRAAITLC
jgi:adenylylsulfate kinase-like enzyme